MSKISIRALIPRGNRKFAQLLSNNVLSEYSTPTETCSSSDAEFYEPPNPTKIKDFEFIEETVDSKDPVAQSLLQMYEKLEKVRNEKWKLRYPEKVELQNMKALKQLIARNFTKKKKDIVQDIEETQIAVNFTGKMKSPRIGDVTPL